jgi:hypothetical protein
LEKHSRQILALISEESDLTLNEIVSALHKRFHKVAGVEEAIRAVGASLRYLPLRWGFMRRIQSGKAKSIASGRSSLPAIALSLASETACTISR